MAVSTVRRWFADLLGRRDEIRSHKPHSSRTRLALQKLEGRDVPSTAIPLNGTTWTQVGPQGIVNGEAPGRPNSTGRFDSVAVNPLNNNVIYAASGVGGIWRTSDGGATWSSRVDRFDATNTPSNTATFIRTVPRTAGDTVYAASNLGVDGFLYLSTDGATTFTRIGTTAFTNRTITSFVVLPDPTDPQNQTKDLIYAAVRSNAANPMAAAMAPSGVYRSTDGGATWVNITAASFPFAVNQLRFSDIDVDPANREVVYASVDFDTATASAVGMYRATNALSATAATGANWQLRLGGSAFFSGTLPGRLQTEVSPVLSSVIFVSVADRGGALSAIYRSTDTGVNWTPLLSQSAFPGGTVPDFMTTQLGVSFGGVYNNIVVAPTSPFNPNQQILYVAGIGDPDNYVLISTNSGQTWQNLTIGANGTGPYVGARQAILDSSGRLVMATEGGIFRLNSRTPVVWQSLNGAAGPGALNSTQVTTAGLGLHPSNSNLATINMGGAWHAAAQFNNTHGWTAVDTEAGSPFNPVIPPPFNFAPLWGSANVYYDFNQPNIIYRVSAGSVRRSNDGGLTWADAAIPFGGAGAFVQNPSDSRILFSTAPNGDVWFYDATQDAGDTFENVFGVRLPSLDFVGGPGAITAIGVSRQSNLVYVATTPGIYEWEIPIAPPDPPPPPPPARTRLYVLDLTGTLAPDWIELQNLPLSVSGGLTNPQAPPPGRITQILVDPNNPLNVYIRTAAGEVFNSRTNPLNITPLPTPPPPPPPQNQPPPPFFFANVTWQQLNLTGGMNVAPQNIVSNATGITALALDPNVGTNPNDDILYVGTNNGVYSLAINPTQTNNFVWQQVGGLELPNRPVTALALNTTTGILGVGLNGRGVWQFQIRTLIRGQKFNDVNGNGVQDPGDAGLAGWVMTLVDTTSNSIVATTVTDLGGFYEFSSVPAGTYTIREVNQVGWGQTTALTASFTVSTRDSILATGTSGPTTQIVPTLNIGNFRFGSISGTKFDDTNQNGIRDAGEFGVAGFTIYIDANNNDILDPGEVSTVTDGNGNYIFTGLGATSLLGVPVTGAVPPYTIREVNQPNWIQTSPNPAPVNVTSGLNVVGVNFGNTRPGSVRGRKFNDLNGNGQFDTGEPGLANWQIFVDANTNGSFDPGETNTLTDANGFFEFLGLPAGAYRFREVNQPGWTQTTPNPADIILTGTNSVGGILFGNFQSINPWFEMGPRPILNGQAPGLATATGRFDSVAVNPLNPNIIFAASSNGGIWRSTDGGLNWSVRTDSAPSLATISIHAIARNNTTTVYAATIGGVYKSVDNGETFTLVGGAQIGAFRIAAMDVRANAATPNDFNTDILYVAAIGGGVLRSTDGGLTWTNISLGFPIPANQAIFSDIDIDPANPAVVYASVGNPRGGATNGIYRVSNGLTAGGVIPGNWTLQIGGSAFFPGVVPGSIRVSISPSAPSVIFASVAERDAPNSGISRLLGIFRSFDSGVNWTGFYSQTFIPSGTVPNFMGNNGNFNNTLIVSPFSPVNPTQQTLYVAGNGDSANNVLVSNDSGVTWTDISVGANGVGPYVNSHGATIDSLGRLILATEGGVYRLNNRAPVAWQSLNGTTGLTSLNTVTVAPFGYSSHPTNPFLGIANIGGDHTLVQFNGRLPAGYGWTTLDAPTTAPFHTNNGPGRDGTGTVFYDYNNPTTMYRVVTSNGGGDNDWIRKSIDGGLTWFSVANAVPGQFGFPALYPVLIDPSNSQRLWTGTDQVSVSNDGGASWTTTLVTSISSSTPIPTLPTSGQSPPIPVTAIGIGRTTGTTIYAATAASNIYRITLPDAAPPADPATTDDWIDLGAPLGPLETITQILVDPNTANRIYAVTDQGKVLSWSNTTGWRLLNDPANGVPPAATGTNTIAIDPRAAADAGDDVLYLGTNAGVFRLVTPSAAGPFNWARVGTGFPNVPVTAIDINTTTGLLTAGTFGRGVWQVQIRALIAGTKFEDINGNGTREAGEPGVAGVVIQVIDANTNAIVATTTTDAQGVYEFRSLRQGNYIVREFGVAGTVQTSTPPPVLTLLETDSAVSNYTGPTPIPSNVQIVPQLDFGNFRFATIEGTKFEDRDGNGVRDAGEPGIAGFVIFIDANDNGTLDPGERSTSTDAAGNYSFTDLGPADYFIREVNQVGFIQTSPNPGVINPLSGQTISGVNFGNIRIGQIAGAVFNDLNGDGTRQFGEPGAAGFTVQLVDTASGLVIRTLVTDTTGTYVFRSLPAGTYVVREVVPAGWIQTAPAAPNPTFFTITLAATDQVSGFDFGNFQRFSVSGVKFEDRNGNGVRDPGDNGVAGFTFIVTNTTTGQTFNAVSDAFGAYTVPNLGPGNYTIAEAPRAGWTQTSPTPAPFPGVSGTNRTGRDFGNFRLVSVTGIVFNDVNGNGTQDPGELGLPGFTVRLDRNADGSFDEVALTNAAGAYTFSGIGPGVYIVSQEPRNGWTITSPPGGAYNFTATSSVNPSGFNFGNRNNQIIAVGRDSGSTPLVSVRNLATGQELYSFLAYTPGFRGGVRTATGNVNGGTATMIVTAAGPGGGPHVRVWNPANGEEVFGFFAYSAGFSGGVYVAVGDVNGDGFDDIVTGAGEGGGPHVRVFSGATRQELFGFFAYAPTFTGGVRVAVADVDGDGKADIITGAGPGGGPHVQVYSGATRQPIRSFFAYDASFTGGVFVAGGDFNGDGKADIVTGAGAGGGPHVRVFNGVTLAELAATFPYESTFRGGVRVDAIDADFDGRADLITGPGPGRQPTVSVYSLVGGSLQRRQNYNAFDPTFLGGIFVG